LEMVGSTRALHANEYVVRCGVGTLESPRLEFFVGTQRLATLTKTGVLRILDVEETSDPTGGTDRFEFYGNGEFSAALGPTVSSGLAAIEIAEPLP
jgi:hypothetical protein